MFKFLVVIGLLICILDARGQTCIVKSFRWEDPRDVKGMPMPMVDLSGKNSAVIKVETRQKNLAFDFGSMGSVIASVDTDDRIWLWAPVGAQNVSIKDMQTGFSCNYPFSTKLLSQEVYTMVLDVDSLKSRDETGIETEWVSIFSFDLDDKIYIDDWPVGKTSYYGSLTRGTHKIRFEKVNESRESTIEVKEGGSVIYQNELHKDYPSVLTDDFSPLINFEDNPEFPGGYDLMQKFIRGNLKYPALAKQSGIEGTVFVQFLVYQTGRVKIIKILKGIGSGCDEEAVRIIRMMPDWIPAHSNGKACWRIFQIPIRFQLPKKK